MSDLEFYSGLGSLFESFLPNVGKTFGLDVDLLNRVLIELHRRVSDEYEKRVVE